MPAALVFLVVFGSGLFAATDVTSREQFGRLMPGGLPAAMHYNVDRAWLELHGDRQNCPASAKGFFELNISPRGEVVRVRDLNMSRTANLKVLAASWAKSLLAQIRFHPLSQGTKATAVHTFATVVCE